MDLKLLQAIANWSEELQLPQPFTFKGKHWILYKGRLLDPGAWYPLPTESPGNTILSSRWNNILTSIQSLTDSHRHDGTDSMILANFMLLLTSLGRKIAWGSNQTGAGGSVVVATGLSTIEARVVTYARIDELATDVTFQTSISGGNMTVQSRDNGIALANAPFTWVAIGT